MDYYKLIDDMRWWAEQCDRTNYGCQAKRILSGAAFAIETLRVENAEMEKQLNEFSEFLCHMTGGLLSKTNYTAQAMISAAEDYQQRVCDNDCGLRADLARVTAERDALIKRTSGDCWSCIRRYECNSRKGPHSRCWEFDPWLLKEG